MIDDSAPDKPEVSDVEKEMQSRMPLVNRHFRRAHKKCELCGGLAIVRKPIEDGQWVLAACPEPR